MLDVITDSIYPARISVEGGFFKEIVPIVLLMTTVNWIFRGLFFRDLLILIFILKVPCLLLAQFAKLAVRFGTTSVVCDPCEIANVAGTDGIYFMIENSKSVPFNFYFSIPSCVPATCFETSGAILDSETIGELLKKDEAVALGEMMNFSRCDNGDGDGEAGQTGKSKRTWKTYRRACASAFRKDLDKYRKEIDISARS